MVGMVILIVGVLIGSQRAALAPHIQAWRQAARPDAAIHARPLAAATTHPAALLPTIRSAELTYATMPEPGVWADLVVVLDDPLPPGDGGPTKVTLLLPGTLLQDFKIRTCEPKLTTPPMRRPDGRYALVFPAPIPQSLNWYRISLETRHPPHGLEVAYLLDGARNLPDLPPVPVKTLYADREADPFMVVPEPLVYWLPGRATAAFPVALAASALLGAVGIVGCVLAFRFARGTYNKVGAAESRARRAG